MTITASDHDGVVTLSMDDGKANAMDLGFFADLSAGLDDAAGAAAVVIAGRPGMFSAGLNTKVLAGLDDTGLMDLLLQFGRTVLRIWLEPRPVVAAATGHAVAGGTILAMAADHAVAATGEYAWGMTETSIGFPMPGWAITLARGNVRADRLDDLLLPGKMIGPAEAVEAGFADELAEPEAVVPTAQERAAHLGRLPRHIYAETKRRLREASADQALAGAVADLQGLVAARDDRA